MKIFLAIVAAFAAVMILLFIAPFVVPTANYKEAVIDEIKQFADGDVTIDSFRFQFLPYPAFTIRGLTISTTKVPFRGVPVFHAAVVQGGLSPAPLFRGKIVTDFTIRDATFDYRIATDRTTNLSLLAREDAAARKRSYVIRSLLITNGTFRYIKEAGQNPLIVDQVELATSDLKLNAAVSASIRLSAVVEGAARQGVNLSGTFLVDRRQKVVGAKQVDLFYGGSRFNVDGSYKYDAKSFDIHFATPSVSLQSLGFLIPSLSRGLPLGIDLSGPFALDTTLSGTKENMVVKSHIDATVSNIRLGQVFNKEPNRPFKIIFSGTYQPAYVTVEDVAFTIGESTFHLAGSLVGQPGYPVQLTLSPTAFDANQLKTYFPFFTIFDELANPAVAINIAGPLLADTGRTVSGHVSAGKAALLAHTLMNLETDFQYATDVITLSTLKGFLYDGALSGNGWVDLKSIPTFHFELVADNLDTAKIPTLPAVMGGIASLVLKADANGGDNVSIRESFSSEGTLVMPNGQLAPMKIGKQILTETVWKTLESYAAGGLDVATRDSLVALESDVKDMKASFGFKNGTLTVSKIEWSHPQYRGQAKGTINLPGEVSGDGNVYISKDTTARLIKDPASRKAVTTSDGSLEIPFVVSGTLMAMAVRPDDTKFADNLKRMAPPALPPVTAEVPTLQAEPAAQAALPPPPAAEAPPPSTPSKKKAAKKTTKGKMSTDVDEDTLKVIIGQ